MAIELSPAAPRATGDAVTDFALRATDGQTYSSKEARSNGLVLAAMFKVGCGTCQYAFPFVQRFQEQYAQNSGGKFQVWGISQDKADATLSFAQEHGSATFPLLLDSDLSVAAQYGLTNVPDLYLLGAEDAIPSAVVGHFSVEGYNALAQQVADYLGVPYVPIVRAEDNAPALQPG